MDSSVCQTAIDAARSKGSAAQHYDLAWYHRTPTQTCRQQTPLLNWGYATRMQCMWSRLHAAVSQLAGEEEHRRLQIVILGPGLDRTGFCLVACFPETIQSLLEVDLGPICALKRNDLLEKDRDEALSLLSPETSASDDEPQDGSVVLQGQYLQTTSYSLVAQDLNGDERSIRSMFDAHLLDDGRPILVVSELVVSYLKPTSCDSLLSYFGHCTHCSILLYEALGGPTKEEQSSSVADAYRRFYHDQFQSKLQRGSSRGGADSATPLFHPLATTLLHADERLGQAGFCSSRTVHPTIQTPCTQLFDEHAAMSLHLQTYMVATAASRDPSQQQHHRWFYQALQGDHVVTHTSVDGTSYRLAPAFPGVDVGDIRQAFTETYDVDPPLSPSIPKMLQAAMRSDLAPIDIAAYYHTLGGNYWICRRASATTNDFAGGLGLRRQSLAEVLALSSSSVLLSTTIPTFEVQRVVVTEPHRGQGVGRALMEDMALAWVRRQGPRCNVVAVTLTVLEAANRFYLALGFQEIERQDKGDLTYVTYWKEVTSSDD